MTGRERLTNIIDKKPIDKLAWTTLVDDKSRSAMPKEIREMPVLDFYRHIGCDVFQFGNYGLSRDVCFIPPASFVMADVKVEWEDRPNNINVKKLISPFGMLETVYQNWHPIEHPVKTLTDIEILTNIWKHAYYEKRNDEVVNESWARVNSAIGDSGVYFQTLEPSPVQTLIEYEMGMMNFYGFLQDYEKEMNELLDVMHERRKQEYEITAEYSPAKEMLLVENTSSMLISPSLYRKYSVPQLRDYGEILRKHGKKMILHMCGHLKNLLQYVKETNPDGYNALTPPPIGDVSCEAGLDILGEDALLFGIPYDSSIFCSPVATPDTIKSGLDAMYSPRVRKANILMGVTADGLATELWRFIAVKEWMEKNGLLSKI